PCVRVAEDASASYTVDGMPCTCSTRASSRPPRPAPMIVTGVVMVVPQVYRTSRFGSPLQRTLARLWISNPTVRHWAHGTANRSRIRADPAPHGQPVQGPDHSDRHRDPGRRRRERSDAACAHGAPED